MRTPTLFKEYIWLVNTIHNAKRISFADINERWLRSEMSEGIPLSRISQIDERAHPEQQVHLTV